MTPSSTLWATASKEWVIPAKPKPGRKPKTEAPLPAREDDEIENAGRRVQNRAAQRAFRERKQSQFAELQARIKLYEQGEIERNVALQNIAKRLKEENEQLRRENDSLKERVSFYEKHHIRSEHDRKRWRDDSSATSSVSSDYPAKRMRGSKQAGSFASYASPPMASSPESNHNSDGSFQAASFGSPPTDETSFTSQSSPQIGTADLQRNLKPMAGQEDTDCTFAAAACAFCGLDANCFCSEIALHETAINRTMVNQMSLRMDHFEHREGSRKPSSGVSILDKLPAYQAPVPLRRRAIASNFTPVFPILMAQHSGASESSATCSGDPANCMACADDSFGQAFCAAIGDSVATIPPCDGCPCRPDAPNGIVDCCSDSTKSVARQQGASASNSAEPPASGTIPTNDAWRQIKSHPNVAFADLSLLADVVARRSKCTGPRVVISPAPGAATPERVDSPTASLPQATPDSQSILLTDPHTHYQMKGLGSQPLSMPQELLINCGRQKLREVRADAVREALHLLDAKFSQS